MFALACGTPFSLLGLFLLLAARRPPCRDEDSGPSFAYFLPVHSSHTRRDRVASLTNMLFAWRGHTKSLTTRAGPSPDLAVWLE